MALMSGAYAAGLDDLFHTLLPIQPRAAAVRILAALELDRFLLVDAAARPYCRDAETHVVDCSCELLWSNVDRGR